MDEYYEELARFKEREQPEVILFLADDPTLPKIAISWSTLSIRPLGNMSPLPGKTDNEIWEWLWENTEYDFTELAEKAGIPEYLLGGKLNSLIGNRILYPDGTINSFVQRYLREKVLRLFKEKPKGQTKRSP